MAKKRSAPSTDAAPPAEVGGGIMSQADLDAKCAAVHRLTGYELSAHWKRVLSALLCEDTNDAGQTAEEVKATTAAELPE